MGRLDLGDNRSNGRRFLGLVAVVAIAHVVGCAPDDQTSPPDALSQPLAVPAADSPSTLPTAASTTGALTETMPSIRPLSPNEEAAAARQLIEAEDCPVGFADLRIVEVPYRGYDGSDRRGTLIVNADVAQEVADLFAVLFTEEFPIQRMDAIDPLPVDDTSRLSSNNTVGFKCRAVRGGSAWSQHAYGHAVDINPVDNPSVSSGVATPPLGADRVDRSTAAPGMIHEGDLVTRAFDQLGWGWGGRWSSHQDYMHFSVNGN